MSSSHRIQNLRKRAFHQQGGRCYYCGVRMWLACPSELPVGRRSEAALAKIRCTAEHLVAQCDGGAHTAGNIVAACARCNHTRHRLQKPPEPPAYRQLVAKQAARRCWHPRWVYDVGLARHGG